MVEEKQIKGPDDMFCTNCGNIISRQAVICVGCGASTGKHNAPFAQAQPQYIVNPVPMTPFVMVNPKNKGTAVVLAIFLGNWTWVYTYQKDAWKFWLNLVLTIVSFGLWAFVAWPWSIIDAAVKPTSWYDNFPLA